MGLFDIFKRRLPLPTELPEALIEAAYRQDSKALASLCAQHRDEIRRSFSAWRTVPAPLRRNAASQDRYCKGLIAIASVFESSGDASLIQLLIGDEADNPLILWERDLTQAQSLMDGGRAGEAVALLQGVLKRTRGLTGNGVAANRARTLGSLGVASFRAGDKTRAIEFTQQALGMCRQVGDEEGVRIYSRNIQHIQDEGRTQTEAPVIVFRSADGRTLTLEELQGVTGTFRYEIVGGADVPAEAKALHQRAREAGGRGEYQVAITLLTKASELAPQWPYPVYDRAYTHLLMMDFEAARTYYQKTVALAPRGFFSAITALDTLIREQKGELPPGTYLAYLSLEWLDDPAKKADMVRQLVNRLPRFAPGWKELAHFAAQDPERLAAIEKGLAGEPDAETRGMLQINKALVLSRHGEHDVAVRLLGELALDLQSTYATEHLAKATLAMVARCGKAS